MHSPAWCQVCFRFRSSLFARSSLGQDRDVGHYGLGIVMRVIDLGRPDWDSIDNDLTTMDTTNVLALRSVASMDRIYWLACSIFSHHILLSASSRPFAHSGNSTYGICQPFHVGSIIGLLENVPWVTQGFPCSEALHTTKPSSISAYPSLTTLLQYRGSSAASSNSPFLQSFAHHPTVFYAPYLAMARQGYHVLLFSYHLKSLVEVNQSYTSHGCRKI